MRRTIDIREFLRLRHTMPVIDVRSPSEYAWAHIPGALSLPLFSDDERARVGTLYKHQGKKAATLLGMDIAGPKMAGYVSAAEVIAPEGKVLVYCWRGGMRSSAMAFTLETAGFEVCLLEGGYRSFRRLVLDLAAHPWKLRVLGGMTGSGKTLILKKLREAGEQVIDLEGLASHKGSAFGSIGQPAQPGTEHFVNQLGLELSSLDPNQSVWVEDESHEIGKVGIPHSFFLQMREAPLYFVEIPREQRAAHLVEEYAGTSDLLLKEAFLKIGKRLGGAQLTEALKAIEAGGHYRAAMISLNYYDKAYTFGLSRRDQRKVMKFPADLQDIDSLVQQLIPARAGTNNRFKP